MRLQMVYLPQPVTRKEVQDGGDLDTTGLHYGLSAMQGWRRQMEDAHLALTELNNDVSLFGIFDGHGGRGVSRFAAAKLPELLQETQAYKEGHYAAALERAFLAVDEKLRLAPGRRDVENLDQPDPQAVVHPLVVPRRLLQKFLTPAQKEETSADDDGVALVDPSRLMRHPTPEAQGCTAIMALVVRGSRLYCANAGDSRAVLSRSGLAVPLSEDHKPDNPKEATRIVKAGGVIQQVPGGGRIQGDLNLSRSFGDLRYKNRWNLPPEEQVVTAFPEVRSVELTGEDEFVVLGCDGVWERTSNQEMIDFVRPRLASGNALSGVCGDICDKSLCSSMDVVQNEGFDGTGCDNMTVIIVQLKPIVDKATRAAELEDSEVVGSEAKKRKVGDDGT